MVNIEIFNEDCLKVLQRTPDSSIDLFIQDPPFGVTQNDWDVAPDLDAMWPEWLRVGKENTAYLFFATQPFATDLINSNRRMFKYDLVWYKPLCSGFLNAKKMPLRNHEHILVFYKKLPKYNPIMGVGVRKKGVRKNDRVNSNYGEFKEPEGVGRYDDNGTRYPQSVIEFTNGDRTTESDHPTQKPVDLIRYLIRTYSNPDDIIFDGYGGSGTTACAAYLEDRQAIVCEIEKDYYEASCKRFKEQTMQQTLFK